MSKKAVIDKREAFCKAYLALDKNITKAAIKAGYSEKTAYSAGSRLLKNVEVQNRINELALAQLQVLDIKAIDILKEYQLIGFSDISQYLTIEDNPDGVKGDYKLKVKDWNKIPKEFLRCIESVQETKDGIRIKLYSKPTALRDLAQYFDLLSGEGKNAHKGEKTLNDLPDEALQERLNRLEKAITGVKDEK